MQHRALPAILAVVSVLAAVTGCTRGISVDGDVPAGVDRRGGFASILVVGVSPDVNQRCAFEQAMASNLRSATVKAVTSCTVMGTKEPLTREVVEKAVAEVGADAVLATVLVDATAKVKEGGSADARGGAYYKATDIGYETGYWGVYGVPVVYAEFEVAPSVFSVSGDVKITSRLFDTRDATLVYVVNTDARGLSSRALALAEITPEIAAHLRQGGLVRE